MEKVYILDKETNITYYLIGIKSINPNQSVRITEYPVPEGSFLSDHAYKTSDTLSLRVVFDAFDNTHQSYYVDLDGTGGALTYDMFRDVLNKWITQATQLDIQTRNHLFRSVILNSLTWNEGDSRNKFEPTLSFQEVRIGYLYTVPLSTLGVKYIASYTQEETAQGKDNGVEYDAYLGEGVKSGSVGGVFANITKYIDPRYWITQIPGVKDSWYDQHIQKQYSSIAKITNAVTGFFGHLLGF